MSRWPPPPTLTPTFFKGHGLGNDYLVFEEGEGWAATPANVRRVCDRHRGVGADGIVALLRGRGQGDRPDRRDVGLRMFNPDGGEFERSGNGLRILASYLASRDPHVKWVDASVGGDTVRMTVHGRSGPQHDVSVEMGRAVVGAPAIGMDDAVLDGAGRMAGPGGERLEVVAVSVGNPHLVVVCGDGEGGGFSEERLAVVGPYLTSHPAIRDGANVQLARPAGGRLCEALIWERGVGRTAASGTSSCAVAVALVASGRYAPGALSIAMPGGTLDVTVSEDLDVVLRGPVEEVMDGCLRASLLTTLAEVRFGRAP
jgi:diaminopimelate epimerase